MAKADTRILIVDDESLIRWSLRWHLERAGHTIIEAENGAQAIDRIEAGVDLVLLDLKLPDTDGLEVLARIKRDRPACPVILMTAHGSQERAGEARRIGAYDLVDKPFDFDAMIGLVEQALASAPPPVP